MAKNPAKDDDTGADDVDDHLFDDSDDAGGGMDMGGGDSATINEVSQELEEMGLMIDPSKDASEFLEHLATAIKTHKSTKALGDGGAGTDPSGGDMAGNNGAAGGQGGAPTPEQNQFTMMSNRRAEAQDKRILSLESELAKGRMGEVLANLDLIQQAELLPKEELDGYRAKLKAKSLSLVRDGDSEIKSIVFLAKKLAITARSLSTKGLLKGLLTGQIDMSRAQAVQRPDGQWGQKTNLSDKDADEAADEIMGKKR
jgi:hypothetical protein